jgi:excisionase family DNA binding protein
MAFREQHIEHTPGSLLTLDEAAQRMNVNPEDVRSMISNNQLPGQQISGQWRVDVAQVDLMTSNEKGIAAALGSDETIDAL